MCQSEWIASFLEDSEGKSVVSLFQHHGLWIHEKQVCTDSKVENNRLKKRPVWGSCGYFYQVRAQETFCLWEILAAVRWGLDSYSWILK